MAAAASRLERRAARDAIAFSFRSILGFEADEEAVRHHLPLVELHPDGRRLLVRGLLSKRTSPSPPRASVPSAGLLPGEATPGEAARAVKVLAEGDRAADDRAFVRLSYERLFLRAADADGEAFYLGKLAGGELSRAGVVRELLWSDEGRQVNFRQG